MTTTLLVGRGLLGREVEAALRSSGRTVATVAVPWAEPERALDVLLDAARAAARDPEGWRLVWTAGAGVVATSEAALRTEIEQFRALISGLVSERAVPEAMFLASSAGGVYGSSTDAPPYTERSVAVAGSPYGHAKLAMEAAAATLAARGGRVVVGRVANLYGPGQNLEKPQGLISQLCRTAVTQQPLEIFVSLDTIRDYLYVGDAARMVVALLDLSAAQPAGDLRTKILASGRATSVGGLVGEVTRVFRRRLRVAYGPGRPGQASDLRMRSVVWPEVDRLARTPLVTGIRATADDLFRQAARGRLPRET